MSKNVTFKALSKTLSIAALFFSLNASAGMMTEEEAYMACGVNEPEPNTCSPQDSDGPKFEPVIQGMTGPLGGTDGSGSCQGNPWNPDSQSCLQKMEILMKQ